LHFKNETHLPLIAACLPSFCPHNQAGALEQVCFSTARTKQQGGLTGITKYIGVALRFEQDLKACEICMQVTHLNWIFD